MEESVETGVEVMGVGGECGRWRSQVLVEGVEGIGVGGECGRWRV